MPIAKITKVTYGKTFNIGNYEAEHIRLEAELPEREYSETELNFIYTSLKNHVHRLHEAG